MKITGVFPYILFYMALFIKVIAFRLVVFQSADFFQLVFIEFSMWALLLSLLLLTVKKRLYLAVGLFNFLVSVIFFTVTLYIRYYSTVPSYYDLQQAYQTTTLGNTIALLANPFDFLFFLDVFFIFYIARRWKNRGKPKNLKLITAAIAVVCLVSTVYAIRQPIVDVSYFAKEHGLLQTQFAQAYHRTIGSVRASFDRLTPEELEELKGNEYVPVREHEVFGMAEGRHLVVIQVESLQSFVLKKTVGGEEITPNLNKLLEESAYFSNVFQQVGAGTTSDAEWMSNTGLYPQGMIPTVNSLNGEPVPSLPRTLEEEGYGSATYHADDISYWNRDILYPVLGFNEIFTNEEVPERKVVGFGPADEVLFDFATAELSGQLKTYERVYLNLVTLTSHTPFELPVSMQGLSLPAHYKETYVGNYLQSIHYADKAIGRFLKDLKDMGIYDESLIVIFGDHSGVHGSPVTPAEEVLLKELIGHRYTLADRFRVPVLFAGGGLFEGQEYEQLGGQVDLMPTILALLGIEHEAPMMGHNMFHYKNNLLGMRYFMPGGSFIESEQLYRAPGARLGDVLYDLKTMKKLPMNKEAKQHIEDTQKILNYGDLLLKPYTED